MGGCGEAGQLKCLEMDPLLPVTRLVSYTNTSRIRLLTNVAYKLMMYIKLGAVEHSY